MGLKSCSNTLEYYFKVLGLLNDWVKSRVMFLMVNIDDLEFII